jgi:hypothetical protein
MHLCRVLQQLCRKFAHCAESGNVPQVTLFADCAVPVQISG